MSVESGDMPEDMTHGFELYEGYDEPDISGGIDDTPLMPEAPDYAVYAEDVVAESLVAEAVSRAGIASNEREALNDRYQTLQTEDPQAFTTSRIGLNAEISAVTKVMQRAYNDGRTQLWEYVTSDGQEYMSGSDNVVRAAELSPAQDIPEAIPVRNARLQAVRELSDAVKPGVPTLITYDNDNGLTDKRTYLGAVPEHEGLSVTLKADSDNRAVLWAGLNGKTALPVGRLVETVRPTIQPGVESWVGAFPRIRIITGESVGRYITNQVTDIAAVAVSAGERAERIRAQWRIGEVEERQMSGAFKLRREARDEIVQLITAANDAHTTLELPDDMRAVHIPEILAEYILAAGDQPAYNRDQVLAGGRALHAIYPADAPQSLADFLIGKSNELAAKDRGTYHKGLAVSTVLRHVCGMARIPERLER